MSFATFAMAITLALAWTAPTGSAAADKNSLYVAKGRKLFMQYCASCHGADARGQGPVAVALKGGPPDLTIIQAQGQKFPLYKVQVAIDGEKNVPARGTSKMPVWGTVFIRTRGELQKEADIFSLVKYVESVQIAGK
jgi:mono/diheme cytochrome c family protein